MRECGDRHFRHGGNVRIVHSDQGNVLRNPDPVLFQDRCQRIGHLIVVADHGGAAVDPLQKVRSELFHFLHRHCVDPEHGTLVDAPADGPHTLCVALIAEPALTVVRLEDPRDLPVSAVHQILCRLEGHARIIQRDQRIQKSRICRIDEQDRNAEAGEP